MKKHNASAYNSGISLGFPEDVQPGTGRTLASGGIATQLGNNLQIAGFACGIEHDASPASFQLPVYSCDFFVERKNPVSIVRTLARYKFDNDRSKYFWFKFQVGNFHSSKIRNINSCF